MQSVWGAGMRAPEMNEQFAGFDGLVGMGRYFATRAAPLGPVPAEVVVATFYNFGPMPSDRTYRPPGLSRRRSSTSTPREQRSGWLWNERSRRSQRG